MGASATPADADYDALIGLGSNIGDKAANIRAALDHLTADGAVRLVQISRFWQSAPWGVEDQDWFVNACAAVATDLGPHELLGRCLAAENALGRVRVQKWGPRVVDVDVLTYRGQTIDTPDLKVPHPFIEQREFVLVPLAEVAPDEVVRGRSIKDMLGTSDRAGLLALG
ncbi:MAG: 2-amino-4-hydroxy-6-hydroxymethyldihydropteridine diphosphokinase [Hyphomicrobium sp.]|nr:2-amino-4-hydroxy-6-hydroxymethyldihydropteridine diphosphokinase [Hyphomicrobium sp.]